MPLIYEELRRRSRETRRSMRLRTAEVVRTAQPTPRLLRVTLVGDDLRDAASGLPADAWKLMLPQPGRRAPDLPTTGPDGVPVFPEGAPPPIWRAYTTRRIDPAAGELDLDVLLHGDGPGPAWARAVRPGDVVGLAGPRHEFYASPQARWHLLVGDLCAAPAVAAILESLPEGVPAVAFLEVEDAADRFAIAAPASAEVVWLERGGPAPEHSKLLPDAVRALTRGFDGAQAWVAGEAGVVREVRRHLLRERELPRQAMHAAAYWKAGRTSDQRDSENLTVYQKAVAAGRDPDDPALLDAELE